MRIFKIINITLATLIILSLSCMFLLRSGPDNILMQLTADIHSREDANTQNYKSSPSAGERPKPFIYSGTGSDMNTNLLPPSELAGIFYQPAPPEPPSLIIDAESVTPELSNEPKPEIEYNTTRLSYLGFTSIPADSGEKIRYLIKDSLYNDIFGISEGEEIYGFSIKEINKEEKIISVTDGADYYLLNIP